MLEGVEFPPEFPPCSSLSSMVTKRLLPQQRTQRNAEDRESYSPYGTQMFLTWVACSRNQRPSASLGLNQSMARPSLVQTCFRLPIDIDFAAAALASSPKHQIASTSSCSA